MSLRSEILHGGKLKEVDWAVQLRNQAATQHSVNKKPCKGCRTCCMAAHSNDKGSGKHTSKTNPQSFSKKGKG